VHVRDEPRRISEHVDASSYKFPVYSPSIDSSPFPFSFHLFLSRDSSQNRNHRNSLSRDAQSKSSLYVFFFFTSLDPQHVLEIVTSVWHQSWTNTTSKKRLSSSLMVHLHAPCVRSTRSFFSPLRLGRRSRRRESYKSGIDAPARTMLNRSSDAIKNINIVAKVVRY